MLLAEWPRFAVELASCVRSQWKSPAALAERQRRALLDQLSFAASFVPFYQKNWAHLGVDVGSLQQRDQLPTASDGFARADSIGAGSIPRIDRQSTANGSPPERPGPRDVRW